jgi:glycosyltransferase involved in cell wall biosynthesis
VVVSCSSGDRAFFESSTPVRRAVVVPNGIDVRRFSMPPAVRRDTRAALGIDDSVLVVLFTASKWGPNQEAFEFLRKFVRVHERELVELRMHFLVVGGVVDSPLRLPALTATGKVDAVEAYFAAADVGINPIATGAGTNVKMGEFMAARLPVLATQFGARGYRIEHQRTGFVFDRERLMELLLELRRMSDAVPGLLRQMADLAFRENVHVISMDECVAPLIDVLRDRPASVERKRQG